MLTALPLAAHSQVVAQSPRIGGARIVVLDNRVWMQVRFGGRGPYSFIVDTGAFSNLIKRDLARELRLRESGQLGGRGIGGAQVFTLYEAREVMLGNIDIGTADFAAYDGTLLHREAAGALSTSILTVADSDLDFEAGEWRIYPDGRGERPGFERLPSEIARSARRLGAAPIFVDAAIRGRTYRLKVDTGAPGQALLFARATQRSGLWNDAGPYVPTQLFGIGGEGGRGRVVRVPDVALGPLRFDRALVTLTDPSTTQVIDSDGLLGIGLLERMNLSTDLRAGRLWAKRNSLRARPERYGLTGLWVEERGGRLVVVVVSPRSPAADAGLQIGDEVHGVPLATFVRRLAGRPGQTVEIQYRRAGETRSARMTLREFL